MQNRANKSKQPSFGVFPQVLSAMLFVALVPLACLWLVNARLSQRDINESITSNLQKTSDALVLQTNNWVDMNLRMLEYASKLEPIQTMDGGLQGPILRAMSDSYEWIFLAFTVASNGQNIGRNDQENPDDYFFGDRSYFKQVMEDDLSVGQQMLIGRTSGKPSLVLAKPVFDASRTKVGIVAMSAQVQEISDAVVAAKVGETGFAFLLDDQGRLIAHGNAQDLSQALQDFSLHPSLQSEVEQVFSYNLDDKQIVTYTQTTDLGWTMVVQQDYNEAFASLRRSRQIGLLLLIVTTLLVVCIAFLLARRFVKPIQNLTRLADDISRGRLSGDISEAKRSDEIGLLAKAIERMRVSIDIAFKELKK